MSTHGAGWGVVRRDRDFRNDFSAGVVSKEFLERASQELTEKALVVGLNCVGSNAGTVMRRCGSKRKFRGQGSGRTRVLNLSDGTIRHLVFRNGFVDVYDDAGALEDTASGPWVTADLFKMTIVEGENGVTVWSNSFYPQDVSYDAGALTVAAFAFRVDSLNRKAAPFYRFGLPGVTMTLSAFTGTGVTMTFSAAVLKPEHVGVRFMYVGCQLLVTGYTSATVGTVTIIDKIYPTLRIGIVNSSNYKVGDLCEGDVTNVRGQVVAVGAGTIDVVLTEGYTHFLAEEVSVPGEKLVSVEASEPITTVTALGAVGATNLWYEELISAARGYPRTAAKHKQRMVIAGFPLLGNLIAASALGAFDDFTLGGGQPSDAILEDIGEDPDAKILHIVSTEQLILLTDRGAWYVPEGGDRRFTPEGIGFNPISPDASSDVPPVWTPEGVVFIDREFRALLLSLTGTQRGAWSAQELTQLNDGLIKNPKQVVYSSGYGGRKERISIVLNGDGTAAVFSFRRGADQAGWYPWERGGSDVFTSISAFNGKLYFYAFAGGFYSFETADFSAVMDGEFAPAVTDYINEDLHVLNGSHVVGEASTDGSGVHDYDAPLDALGRDFAVSLSPAALVNSNVGRVRRRNAKAFVKVLDSGNFRINGVSKPGYPFDADMEAPPPVRDREEAGKQQGSSIDRTISIDQYEGEGAPLHIHSISLNVVSYQ